MLEIIYTIAKITRKLLDTTNNIMRIDTYHTIDFTQDS